MSQMLLNQNEKQLFEDNAEPIRTSAAFCPCYHVPNTNVNNRAVIACMDWVHDHHVWLAELRLVKITSTVTVASQYQAGIFGPVNWGYILQYNIDPREGLTFEFNIKQIAFNNVLAAVLAMYIQADIVNAGLVPHGNVPQPINSIFLGMGAADFVNYFAAFLAKRYSQYNTAYLGTELPQQWMFLFGGTDQTYFAVDAPGYTLPTEITEICGRLLGYECPIKRKGRVLEVMFPILVGYQGPLYNANPFDIVAPSISIASFVNLLYPAANFATYVFGAGTNSKYPLDMGSTNYAKFMGTTPATLRTGVNSIEVLEDQNFPVSPALGTMDNPMFPNMYFTAIVEPVDVTQMTYDPICTADVFSLTNKFAFDPNMMLKMVRVLPIAIVQEDEIPDYTAISNETKSMELDTTVGKMAGTEIASVSNFILVILVRLLK